MHTDDQFADTLTRSLHAGTADLHYTGPVPTATRPMHLAAPVAAAATLGLGVIVAAHVGSSSSRTADTATRHLPSAIAEQPTHQVANPPQMRLVGKTLRVAGLTLRYTQLSDAAPLYAQQADSVPSGAQQVDNDWSVKVYLGVQPQTGYQAAFVVTASGQILAITSPDATQAQLRTVVQAPVGAVPSVGG